MQSEFHIPLIPSSKEELSSDKYIEVADINSLQPGEYLIYSPQQEGPFDCIKILTIEPDSFTYSDMLNIRKDPIRMQKNTNGLKLYRENQKDRRNNLGQKCQEFITVDELTPDYYEVKDLNTLKPDDIIVFHEIVYDYIKVHENTNASNKIIDSDNIIRMSSYSDYENPGRRRLFLKDKSRFYKKTNGEEVDKDIDDTNYKKLSYTELMDGKLYAEVPLEEVKINEKYLFVENSDTTQCGRVLQNNEQNPYLLIEVNNKIPSSLDEFPIKVQVLSKNFPTLIVFKCDIGGERLKTVFDEYTQNRDPNEPPKNATERVFDDKNMSENIRGFLGGRRRKPATKRRHSKNKTKKRSTRKMRKMRSTRKMRKMRRKSARS
jgi:hypothetical protein